ncbi:hypothetical protein EDC56_0352 [Sinobacterium caligoides]|uniref:Uncharacterized protein n=1 Tax=Sinobacterium caligoides TaxID=933926 RepID=A0A3N2DYE0_9GAMM|nr:hypothetical protein [Sinobacterium caligoides]ROS04838.1 hypothetical protein EDC56_0352 [Sinobacterium caligoides]
MRMRTLIFWSFLASADTAFGACETPKSPEIADGLTATKIEMVESKKMVSHYLKSSKEYLACLKAAEALDEIEKPKIQGGYTENSEKYVSAVSEMSRVKDAFMHQVSLFKSR